MVSKSTTRIRVDALIGDNSDITDAKLDTFLEAANDEILDLHDWQGKYDHVAVDTDADYSTGTVAAAAADATLTGSGTSWTSALTLNRYIRIDGDDTYHKIITYTSSTSLEMQTNWELATVSGKTYVVFTLYYAPSTTAAEIINVKMENQVLQERSRSFIDGIDPNRDATGDPLYWAYGPHDSSNDLTIELYPRSTTKRQLEVFLSKEVTISNDSDEIVYPSSMLMWKSAHFACEYLAAQTDDMIWNRKAIRFAGLFERTLPVAIQADKERSDLPAVSGDVMFGGDDSRDYDYWTKHAE